MGRKDRPLEVAVVDPDDGRVPREPPAGVGDVEAYLGAFTNYERQHPLPEERRFLGPERARVLLDRLGLLPPCAPVVQVAGSKGKGSVVLWMEGLLRVRGIAAGAFLSPHLVRLTERIRVDGREISAEEVVAALGEIHPHLLAIERERPDRLPTFFDLWTAVAVDIFRRREVECILLEVGLGGPLDSTSAVPHDCGVITTIDLEHRALLGDRLEEIAAEKAHIARADRALVIAEPRSPGAEAAARVARKRGARVIEAAADGRLGQRIEPPQKGNLSAAIAALEALDGIHTFTVEEVMIAARTVRLPARLEILPGPPPLLLDSAHTPRSLEWLRRRFRTWRGDRPGTLLIGLLGDKEWREALAPFLDGRGENAGAARDAGAGSRAGESLEWIVTRPESPRALDPRELASLLASRGADHLIEEDALRALELLRKRGEGGRAVAVTGSFTLAGLARSFWGAPRA